MPCYLFTYHGFGTWLPGHRRGYVRRGEGVRPPNRDADAVYRRRMNATPVRFTPAMQGLLVETARGAGKHLDATVHAVFTEPTPIHVLVSWRHARGWKSMRSSIKHALTRAPGTKHGRRRWFVDSASRKRVRDGEHFAHLMTTYREKHRGARWAREEDLRRLRGHDGAAPP